MDLLEQAIAIAHQAHSGQVDKAGQPYIEHPLRVMAAVDSLEAKIVAVLHDVIEDTPLSLEDLGIFPTAVVAAINALTKRPSEDYEAYLTRVMADPLALVVKIADMTDNLDISRIPQPTAHDYTRLSKYQAALPRLKAKLKQLQAQEIKLD
jgi:(p)ppGpp synthase/HD superfamily hydrolase